jgi:hypothetical protein
MPFPDGRGALAEALVSWLSLYGVIAALYVYWTQATRTRLELCVMFLLECLGVLLLVRGFYWISGLAVFGIATYFVAALIPFAVLLFVEALLRRHFPLLVKVFVLAGTVLFVTLALAGRLHSSPLWLPAFTFYAFAMQLVLAGAIVFRDRADLTPVEDRAASAIAVAVMMIFPFVVTDLASDLGLQVARVGSVGILMFVHATVVASEPRGSARSVFAGHLAVIGLATVSGAIQAYVIGDMSPATVARSAAVFACILLLVMIHTRVRAHDQIGRGPGLARSIAAADTRSTESFLQVLELLPIVAGYRLLRAADLTEYDFWNFQPLFQGCGTHVITRSQLERRLRKPLDEAAYDAEQLEVLLEREGMSHAVLIHPQPLVLLLVQIPSPGLEQAASAQLELIRTVAEAIERNRVDA